MEQLLESLPKVGKHGGCGIDAGAATMVSAARGGEGDGAKRGKWRGRLGFVPGRGGVSYPLGAPADGCPVAIGAMDVRPASTGASVNRGRRRWEVGWTGTLCTHGPCAQWATLFSLYFITERGNELFGQSIDSGKTWEGCH